MGSLNFTCEPYSPNYWCWASVTEAVHRFYAGDGSSMCAIVNAQLNRADCCGSGPGGVCDVPCDLQSSLRAADCLQNGVSSAVAPNLIRSQLSIRRPLGAFIEWSPDRPGHFVVITGIEPNNSLWIIDPQTGPGSPQSWDYLAFRDRYRDIGHWRATYFTKPPSD